MGFRCPVCSDPQADDSHLADHIAFTALVRGGDHEVWLDEHVPDWADMDTEALAPRVTEHAESTEYPQVFEDTTGTEHDHENARDTLQELHEMGQSESPDPSDLSHPSDSSDPSDPSHPNHSFTADLPNEKTDEVDIGLPSDDRKFDDETRAAIERARDLTSDEPEVDGDADEPSDAGNS